MTLFIHAFDPDEHRDGRIHHHPTEAVPPEHGRIWKAPDSQERLEHSEEITISDQTMAPYRRRRRSSLPRSSRTIHHHARLGHAAMAQLRLLRHRGRHVYVICATPRARDRA